MPGCNLRYSSTERRESPPVVATLLGVTLSLEDRIDIATYPVGLDDARVPNGTQQTVQLQKGGGSLRFQHFSVDTAPSRSFPIFQLVDCRLVSSKVGGSQLTGRPQAGQRQHHLETLGWGVHTIQLTKVARPSGPNLRFPRQCRPISRIHCKIEWRGPGGTERPDFSVGISKCQLTTNVALNCLADSADLRLFGPPYCTYTTTLQLAVLFGLPFESSPATLLGDVQGFVDQKVLGRSKCTSQTALRHLQDFGLQVSSEFLRIVGIVRFAANFRKFPSVLLGNSLVPETADIQPH